jgi:hypothetical protein
MKVIFKLAKGYALRFWLQVGCYWRRLKNIAQPGDASITRSPCHHQPSTSILFVSLFAVRMLVPPLPVIPLVSGSLLVVCTITSMMLYQVAPVRMIFAVIPIMVVAMVRIIDPYLYAFLG